MRSILTAGFLLSPMLIVASAAALPPSALKPVAEAPATTEYHRITTGVAVPAALDTATFHLPAGTLTQSSSSDAKVTLALKVDEKGNAQDVHVVRSANPELDVQIVSAVLQSRFRPATMNRQPIAVDMNLTFSVQR